MPLPSSCAVTTAHSFLFSQCGKLMNHVCSQAAPRGRAPIVDGDSVDPMASFASRRGAQPATAEDYGFVGSDEEREAVAAPAQTMPPELSSASVGALGRGRGSTLPAWMTDPDRVPGNNKRGGPEPADRKAKKHKKVSCFWIRHFDLCCCLDHRH